MGGKGSKAGKDVSASKKEADVSDHDLEIAKYTHFRDELLKFSLGESAYDYAEKLYKKNPDDKHVMALLAETTAFYDADKNKVYRDHWVDRLDLLQRGVDVSRKCIKENPDFGPCYRSYVVCAARESEALYYLKSMTGLGLVENYHAIMKRGEQGMKLMPKDAVIPNTLGALSARCAYKWYDPSRWYAMLYKVPNKKVLLDQSIKYHLKACENEPDNLEYACRLAQAYYQKGDMANARRWFVRVRDEMPPRQLEDDKWQGWAHTQLATGFSKTTWNVPFG